jgi:hypothetical protein
MYIKLVRFNRIYRGLTVFNLDVWSYVMMVFVPIIKNYCINKVAVFVRNVIT